MAEEITLYFKRSNGERVELGHPTGRQECLKMINEHLAQFPKFKSYYTRIWTEENGETWFDVGSHTEFYVCTGLNMNDFANDKERNMTNES